MSAPHLSFGRLWYLLRHRPQELLDQTRRAGGPVNQWITHRARLAMRAAAAQLPTQPRPLSDAPVACFLTGRNFWYQTAHCAASLSRVAPGAIRYVFHDDGTLDTATQAEAGRLFPGSIVVTSAEIEARLDTFLPAAKFPTLRQHRRSFMMLRKITDIHAGRTGARLYLDSDMLFFRRPTALLDWLASPSVPLHMCDIQNAYGYPEEILLPLCGHPLPPLVNAGLLGVTDDFFDWEKLEQWDRTLLECHGSNYYMEQGLTAMFMAGRSISALPTADYLLLPSEEECRRPTAVLHHYVANSKRGYFRHAWRHTAPS